MRGDVANMLSGEEILDLFKESGFDILHQDVVTNSQLASSPVITITTSHNFMFVAQKR
jgi:predicted methyltransferase MtxX (methanogen marker protein 4)